MKNMVKLLGIAALALVIGFTMTACNNGTTDDDGPEPIRLAAPSNLQLHREALILTWNAVANASGYTVDVNGKEYDNKTSTTFSLSVLTEPGIYPLKVKAKGNKSTYTDSAWSTTVSHTVGAGGQPLAAPTNLQINSTTKILTWTVVTNASAYLVDIDGSAYQATTNSFSLSVLSDYKTYTIKVKALGNGTTSADSEWSGTTTYTLQKPTGIDPLGTPANVQITGKNVTWSAVTNALGYSVEINGVQNEATTTTYSLSGLTTPGTYTIRVKAIGDDVTYINSEWSQSVSYTVSSQRLDAPSGLQINDGVLTWVAVNNASAYTVDINGTEYPASTNSYSLSGLTPGSYNIRVKAKSSESTFTDSDWSSTVPYTVSQTGTQRLATPSNLKIEGTT
jgi:hypothetical protein